MNIITIATYELIRFFRMKSVFLILFLLPLVLIFILGSALSNIFVEQDRDIEQVGLAFYSADDGFLQEPITQFLQNDEMEKYVAIHPVQSRDEVVEMITGGKVDYGLVIPADFSEKIFAGQAAEWEQIRGSKQIKNMTAEAILSGFLEQTNMYQSAAVVLGHNPLETGSVIQHSEVRHVQSGSISRSDSQFTAFQYYAASMLIMFLLYSGMTMAISFVTERDDHTLMRLNSMPISSDQIILAKLIGNGLIAAIQALLIILFTALVYGVDWGKHYWIIAVIVLAVILISMSIGLILMVWLKTTKAVTIMFQAIIIVMTFLSGGFSPDIGSFLTGLGKFTVSFWATDGLLQVMLYHDSSAVLQHQLILVSISLVLLLTSFIVYRRVDQYE